MPPYDRPQIDTRLVGKGMDGTRRAALLRDVGVATGEALQTIDRIEAEQGTEGAPLQHPRIDLPFVAAQLELLGRRGARPHRHRILPLGELAHGDARRLLLVCQAGVSKEVHCHQHDTHGEQHCGRAETEEQRAAQQL